LHEVVIDSNTFFAASANVGYCIFTYANEKFTYVFVRALTKSDAMGSTLVNLATDWKIVMQQWA